jgi:hypothetical protein
VIGVDGVVAGSGPNQPSLDRRQEAKVKTLADLEGQHLFAKGRKIEPQGQLLIEK